MQQHRNQVVEIVRTALASTAPVSGFTEQFTSEKQQGQLVMLLERVVLASHAALNATYNDFVGFVVPHLALQREVFADTPMYTEVRQALYRAISDMRCFDTAEDIQLGFRALQREILSLAKAERPGYTPEDRENFVLATSIGTLQWLDVPVPGLNATQRAECAVLERTELVEFIAEVQNKSPATEQARRLEKENAELRRRVGELEAARIAYASEFPYTEDGDPDVWNIHANIRKLKASAKVAA